MASFSESEKARLFYHLGHPYAGSGASLSAGLVRAIPLVPQLTAALELLKEEAVPLVRETLELLEQIDRARRKLPTDARVSELGKAKLRADARTELVAQYDDAVATLATQLGTYRNPGDPRLRRGGAGSAAGKWRP